MRDENMCWDLMPNNRMSVGVWKTLADKRAGREPAMRFFLGEAIENAGRKNVMKHVKECDRSPWLPNWAEPYDATFKALKNSR